MSIFTHTHVPVPDNAVFKLSPSSIGKYFDYPSIWYKEQVLGHPNSFTGNTSSVIGTAMHYIGEQYANSVINSTEFNGEAVRQQIENDLSLMNNSDVNFQHVLATYADMGRELCNQYIKYNIPEATELELCQEIHSDVYVAGSCDAYGNGVVVDYKSASTKPNTSSIPFGYKIQALTYAWMLKQQGKQVDRIRIVYVVQPTKTLPIRVFPITEQITQSDWNLVEDTLNLIADSILLCKENPDLAYIVFKSMSLHPARG